MENKQVTLEIAGDGPHQYMSDVRLYNVKTGTLFLILQQVDFNTKQIALGNLTELADCHLIVDTIAQKESSNSSAGVSYIIQFGETQVEKTIMQSASNEKTAFFHFRFKFCPRFPFC